MSTAELPIEGKTVKALVSLALKRTFDIYVGSDLLNLPVDEASQRALVRCKYEDEYAATKDIPLSAEAAIQRPQPTSTAKAPTPLPGSEAAKAAATVDLSSLPAPTSRSSLALVVSDVSSKLPTPTQQAENAKKALQALKPSRAVVSTALGGNKEYVPSAAIAKRLSSRWPRPEWHAPWRCYRVISGHLGWVRSLAFDVGNQWFVTGSADRTIKLWDTATGTLKLTLTGHIEQVTGLAVSADHPYMFSCGLDKKVMCWDLETNKVIRHYHGHLSGVYSIALHPTLPLVFTGGRDSVCRMWDMRTKVQISCLSGHQSTVASILTHGADPQCITGSHDNNIRLWDIRAGKTLSTLTYHKHSVRALAMHPHEWSFVGASADNIKKYKLPDGDFQHNMLQQQRGIINAACINQDGVIAAGADNGSLWFYDWRSGNCFQEGQTVVQPGSLESEAGIFAMDFDRTGSRLVTCEADKTVKMWKEDENATPETHPIQFRPPKNARRP